MRGGTSIVSLTKSFPARPGELYCSLSAVNHCCIFSTGEIFLALHMLYWLKYAVLVNCSLPFCRSFHRYLNAGERLSSPVSSGLLTLKAGSLER